VTVANYDRLVNPRFARQFLAARLREGTLVLFLGAGTSVDLGIPNWVRFLNGIRKEVGLSALQGRLDSQRLQIAADEVRQVFSGESEYFALLRRVLYMRVPELSPAVLKNDLLTAIAATLIGSKRGSIRRIITLNFDSMLEWFLSLQGYVTRVVSRLPELEGSEDVRIYHPFGFLPHPSLRLIESKFVILGSDSVNLRLGTLGDAWYEMMRYLIRSGVCLFVGLSERSFVDPSLASILTPAAHEMSTQSPMGIWLLKNEIGESVRNRFLSNRVVPIVFSSKEEVPQFLLSVCQEAAERASVRPSI